MISTKTYFNLGGKPLVPLQKMALMFLVNKFYLLKFFIIAGCLKSLRAFNTLLIWPLTYGYAAGSQKLLKRPKTVGKLIQ